MKLNPFKAIKSLNAGRIAIPTALALAPGFAFAAGESTGVIAKITEYTGEAVLICVAFAVAVWTVRAIQLLRKGG